jgi:hypothetical protein
MQKIIRSQLSLFAGIFRGGFANYLCALLLGVTLLMLAGCSSSSSSSTSQNSSLAGNWQFLMTNPDQTPPSQGGPPTGTQYGLQGGFLLQSGGTVTGQAVYSISGNPTGGGSSWDVCDSGSAQITGTISGQTVNLTVATGSQTFILQGTLGSNGSITGTFTTPGGTAAGFSNCGMPTSQSGTSAWTATLVPPLSGTITGSFHSSGSFQLNNQDFAVTGTLTQGENIGASNATITGTLNFVDPTTLISNYPCFGTASVNGQISGNNVILQIIGINGANIGQIGGTVGSAVNPVTFTSIAPNVYAIQSVNTPGYVVDTPSCSTPSGGYGDGGNLCLALNNPTACQQPITISPASLVFPAQLLGSAPAVQTITLTNNSPSGATLSNLTLKFIVETSGNFAGFSEFNGVSNYTATDNCVDGGQVLPPTGAQQTISALAPGQSCTITVSFSPQESCFWLPYGAPSGTAPENCPISLGATVTLTNPASTDTDSSFAIPITGSGISFIQPSTPELDFSSEAVGEASQPQMLTFTNTSPSPVQILGSAPCVNPPGKRILVFPNDPLVYGAPVAGLLVAVNSGFSNEIIPDNSTTTIDYNCDLDPTSDQPNFQISQDSCTGALLPSQSSCSVEVTYVPQPATQAVIGAGLDFFLQLNTVQCWPVSTPPANCEIDSGRFPVELKSNGPSPLRMLPAAGIDFGTVSKGKSSAPQTVTLLNDPAQNTPISFLGKIQASGSYSETDDCPFTMTPGTSCTLTVTLKPSSSGLNAGKLTINYTPAPAGNPQIVYLRGTGQ